MLQVLAVARGPLLQLWELLGFGVKQLAASGIVEAMLNTFRILPALLALAIAPLPSIHAQTPISPLANGDFESDHDQDKWPDNWTRESGASWESEDGNRFVRLKQTEPGKMIVLYNAVPVGAQKNLTLSLRVRYQGVKPGAEKWNDARLIFHFKDAQRKPLNPDPAPLYFLGDSNGWQEKTVRLQVPQGAALLEIMPSLFQVQSGTLDIDDLNLRLAAQDNAPAAPQVLAAPSEPTNYVAPPELKVVDNQIRDGNGKTVWLQGVNVPSLEWMPEGEHVLQSIREAVGNWKASVIRLPVNDEYWFGKGPRQDDGGAKYRALVNECIRAVASRGAYIVLDLHKYKAVRAEHIEFWKQAATVYKNNSAVLFDIINEPHDISWAQWKNGGTIIDKPAQDGKPAETFESPGMQKAVDAIRATGARNIIVAGGLDWSYDLSGVLQGFALDDRGGNGIVYSSHVYPWKKDWANKMLAIAARHPVLLGEVGVDPKPVGDNPNESGYTWAPDMLGTIQKHHLHWTAWSFHTDATPRVLQDWDYNPTPFWGAWVKAALLGARFETNRLR